MSSLGRAPRTTSNACETFRPSMMLGSNAQHHRRLLVRLASRLLLSRSGRVVLLRAALLCLRLLEQPILLRR